MLKAVFNLNCHNWYFSAVWGKKITAQRLIILASCDIRRPLSTRVSEISDGGVKRFCLQGNFQHPSPRCDDLYLEMLPDYNRL